MAVHGMAEDRLSGILRRGFSPAFPLAVLALFGLLLLLLLGIALFGRASDGVPVSRVPIVRRTVAATAPPPLRGALAPHSGAASAPAARPADGANPPSARLTENAPQPVQAPAKPAKPLFAGRALIADPALIEETPQGPLPRIADDGRTPMTAYAPPAPAGNHPRIALVLVGLGISAKETAAALDQLPPQVTLAFAPYAYDVQRWVAEARQRGHEVLLEIPMEPYDFPDSDPGPHTLRAAVSEESNAERLAWSLSRFTGYAGVTNLLGSRFLSDPDSVATVMTAIARRGLFFFNSGPEAHTVAGDVARQVKAPYAQSEIAIDDIQTAMEIDARLSDLETRARADGAAAGTAFVYPVTLERVAGWSKGLAGRGFVLVPASAIVGAEK